MYAFALEENIGGRQAVADVTAYIATLLMSPDPDRGRGDRLQAGRQLYEGQCGSCHGMRGEGSNDRVIPRLQGQHYAYLVRQLQQINTGGIRNVDPGMMAQVKLLGEADIEAVSDYISRLVPDAGLLAPPDWENPDFNFGIQ